MREIYRDINSSEFGYLYDIGVLDDGSLHNPKGYPEDQVRAVLAWAAEKRRKRRSDPAKKAAVTRKRRSGRASARRPPSGSLPRSTVIALQRLAQRRLYRSIKVAIAALFATRDAEQTALVPRVHVASVAMAPLATFVIPRHPYEVLHGLVLYQPQQHHRD
jgi:hypothetical protein